MPAALLMTMVRANIEVTYFRDISHSTRRLFETRFGLL